MAESVFKDNVVVITGASAGIGLEIARRLAKDGAHLVLGARSADLLEQAAKEFRASGARVISVPTDVSDRDQCEALINAAIREFGRIDTLINNAGISMHARFDELHDIEAVERITAINYFGAVYCTWFALPHLKKTQATTRPEKPQQPHDAWRAPAAPQKTVAIIVAHSGQCKVKTAASVNRPSSIYVDFS